MLILHKQKVPTMNLSDGVSHSANAWHLPMMRVTQKRYPESAFCRPYAAHSSVSEENQDCSCLVSTLMAWCTKNGTDHQTWPLNTLSEKLRWGQLAFHLSGSISRPPSDALYVLSGISCWEKKQDSVSHLNRPPRWASQGRLPQLAWSRALPRCHLQAM